MNTLHTTNKQYDQAYIAWFTSSRDFIVFITDEIAHETSIVETIDLNL